MGEGGDWYPATRELFCTRVLLWLGTFSNQVNCSYLLSKITVSSWETLTFIPTAGVLPNLSPVAVL